MTWWMWMAINILIHSLLSHRSLLQIEIPPDALTLAAEKNGCKKKKRRRKDAIKTISRSITETLEEGCNVDVGWQGTSCSWMFIEWKWLMMPKGIRIEISIIKICFGVLWDGTTQFGAKYIRRKTFRCCFSFFSLILKHKQFSFAAPSFVFDSQIARQKFSFCED